MIHLLMRVGCLLFSTLLLAGCSGKNLVFGTYTELDVAGVEARATGNVSLRIGYARGEEAYVPDNGKGGYSVLGTFDSDIQLFSGYYVNEVFATGEAANIASAEIANRGEAGSEARAETEETGEAAKKAGANGEQNSTTSKPLLVTTGTRFGFHSNFSVTPTAVSAIDVLLGYKRANFTIVPTKEDDSEARSVYADIIIGEGSRRARAAAQTGAAPGDSETSQYGKGLIISQQIATGQAAQHLAGSSVVQNRLLNIEDTLATRNDLSDKIKKELNRVKSGSGFTQAKLKLDALAGRTFDSITAENFLQTAQAYLDNNGLSKLLTFMQQLH